MKFRKATVLGDLVMTWSGKDIGIDGRLSTTAEREQLTRLLREHNLEYHGSLTGHATVSCPEEIQVKHFLRHYLGEQVGDSGLLVYAVDADGNGEALYNKEVSLETLDTSQEIVATPRPVGG